MKVFACLLAFCALSACYPPSPTKKGTSLAGEPVTSLASIKGPWAIVRFRDFEPSWRTNVGWRGAYVRIREDGLAYSIGCNHSGNRARLDEQGILHTESDYPSTLVGCSADAKVKDHDFYGFFRTKPRVTRIGRGRIGMSSNDTELILERPELRRRANALKAAEIQGRWVPQFVDNFCGSGMSGFSMEEPRGVVTISSNAINWSVCPEASVAVAYSTTFHLERLSGPVGDCNLGDKPGRDGAAKLMTLMRSNPAVERTGRDTMVLFTDQEAVHLQRGR